MVRTKWQKTKIRFRWRYCRNKRVPPIFDMLVLFFVGWLVLIIIPHLSSKPEIVGGTAGLAESFFAGLAFLGVIYAIVLQKHELGLQRQELRLTRIEMEANRQETKRIADANQKSEEALNKQAKSLLYAAYLNALNTLLHGYSEISGESAIANYRAYVQARVETVLKAIQELVGPQPVSREIEWILIQHFHRFLGNLSMAKIQNDDPPITTLQKRYSALYADIRPIMVGDPSLAESLSQVSSDIQIAMQLSTRSSLEVNRAREASIRAFESISAWVSGMQ